MTASASLPRLSDLQIEDDVLRAMLYSDVLALVAEPGQSDVFQYDILLDEEYRPDLTAYRAYGSTVMRWVISLVADIEDEADPLPVGEVLRLPSPAWVRERIRHYTDGGGI